MARTLYNMPIRVYRSYARRTSSVERTYEDWSIEGLDETAVVHPDVSIIGHPSVGSLLDELLEIKKGKTYAMFKKPPTIPRVIPFTPSVVAPTIGGEEKRDHLLKVIGNVKVETTVDVKRGKALEGVLTELEDQSAIVLEITANVGRFQKG